MKASKLTGVSLLLIGLIVSLTVYAQRPQRGPGGRAGRGDASLASNPFRGISANGKIEKGLFKIESTGVTRNQSNSRPRRFWIRFPKNNANERPTQSTM